MSSDAELSTEDLARPTGRRGDEPSVTEDRISQPEQSVTPDREGGPAGGWATTSETSEGADVRPGEPGSEASAGWGGAGATGTAPGGGATATDMPVGQTAPDSGTAVAADSVDGGMQQPATGRGGAEEPAGGMSAQGANGAGGDVALLDPADGEQYRQRWSDVQARFVDDPQDAVRTADALVAELMQSLARGFSEHKGRLESQWQSGGTPDTEELRRALQMYRSFFNRLLAT